MRLEERFVALTASGKHKEELSAEDILVVDLDGHARVTAFKENNLESVVKNYR